MVRNEQAKRAMIGPSLKVAALALGFTGAIAVHHLIGSVRGVAHAAIVLPHLHDRGPVPQHELPYRILPPTFHSMF